MLVRVGAIGRSALGSSVPSWVMRDETGALPSLFLNFELGLAYYLGQVVPISSLLTVVRASGGYNAKLDGSLQWFGNNALRQTDAGLLVEGARTNQCLRSEAFATGWTADNGSAISPTITDNFALAPNGTMTAARGQFNKTGGTFSRITSNGIVSTVGLAWVYSIYLKSNTGAPQNVGLRLGSETGVNVVVTPTWQRFVVPVTLATTSVNAQVLLWDSIVGNDETADILMWGAQLEAAAFASSYTPTGASAATRAADNISVNDVSFIGSEGTFFAETFGSAGNDNNGRIIGLTGGVTALNRQVTANGLQTYNGTQSLITTLGSGTWSGLVRSAMAYDGSGRALCANAGTVGTDANALGAVANVRIGSSGGGSSFFFGNIRKLAYYPRKISNAGLQQMTAV